MVFGFDIFGVGSKRKWALKLLDSTLVNLEVSSSQIDDGMKYVIYDWALQDPRNESGFNENIVDSIMKEAATMISFCVLGPAETEELWGATVRQSREQRFTGVLENGENDSLDARIIKLILAKGIAAADIKSQVELE